MFYIFVETGSFAFSQCSQCHLGTTNQSQDTIRPQCLSAVSLPPPPCSLLHSSQRMRTRVVNHCLAVFSYITSICIRSKRPFLVSSTGQGTNEASNSWVILCVKEFFSSFFSCWRKRKKTGSSADSGKGTSKTLAKILLRSC